MRNLQAGMAAFLDAKLENNGLAQHAIQERDARTVFRLALESCVGIREATGNNDDPIVEMIQRTIGNAEHESWCMGFIQTGLAYAELRTGLVSPIVASEHCMTVWNDTKPSQRVKFAPLPGSIVIWRHGAGPSGHTGCVVNPPSEGWFNAVEGNTEGGLNGAVVVREGGGVYYPRRKIHGSATMQIMGYLRPF